METILSNIVLAPCGKRPVFWSRGTRHARVLSILCCLAALNGCGRAVNRSAERRVRDMLPTVLGPARLYTVHVTNSAMRTAQGRLSDVTIDGEDIAFRNGLLLDQLHLDLKDVDVDMKRSKVRSIGEAKFTATLTEKSMDEFLAGETPSGETIRDIHVRLADQNMVTLSAERMTLGVGVPFRLTGPVRLAGPARIEIDPTRMTVVGIPISGLPLRFLKRRFESAVDLTGIPFAVQLSSLQTAPGKLTLAGTANTASLVEQTQDGAR